MGININVLKALRSYDPITMLISNRKAQYPTIRMTL